MIFVFLFLPHFFYTGVFSAGFSFLPLFKRKLFFSFSVLPQHLSFPSCCHSFSILPSLPALQRHLRELPTSSRRNTSRYKTSLLKNSCVAPEHPGRGSSLHFTTELSPNQIGLECKFCIFCSSLEGLWSVWNSLCSSLLRLLACKETVLSSPSDQWITW